MEQTSACRPGGCDRVKYADQQALSPYSSRCTQEMSANSLQKVAIEAIARQPLTKNQKQFNAFIKKIEKLKAELLVWKIDVQTHYQHMFEKHNALLDEYDAQRLALISVFDRAYGDRQFKRAEKAKLKDIIASISAQLLERSPSEDVRVLYDKYKDVVDEAESERMKSMLEDVFGCEADDAVDFSDPESVKAYIETKEREENAAYQKRQEDIDARRASRKKTANQRKKEEQQKTETQNIHKSLQSVFRKLVAAIHPDREADNLERVRKTELMQRANIAYNNKDLLQLLTLQLETEQIDSSHINTLSDERLQYFNKILKNQCNELLLELDEVRGPFLDQFALSFYSTPSPVAVMARMDDELKNLRRMNNELRKELRGFQNPAVLKRWLRDYEIPL